MTRQSVRRSICNTGFSLLEMLVTMAILLTLSTLAIPRMQATMQHQRATTAANQLIAHLGFARNRAILQRRSVSLCPSSDGTTCRGDSDWSHGWLVFNGRATHPAGFRPTQILLTSKPLAQGLRMQGTAGRTQIRFLPDGRSPGSNTTFAICSSSSPLLNVIVNNAGRARVHSPAHLSACATRDLPSDLLQAPH